MAEQRPDTERTAQERDERRIGMLGWISVAGFLIMGALYLLAVSTGASALTTPGGDLAIAIVAGIGALLFWFGNDPTAA